MTEPTQDADSVPTDMKPCAHCNGWSVPAGRCRHGDLCYRCATDLDEWTFGQIEHPEGKQKMMWSVWPKRAGEDTVELHIDGDACICGEINARHCPVHKDGGIADE